MTDFDLDNVTQTTDSSAPGALATTQYGVRRAQTAVERIYDEHTRHIYCFDTSYSMSALVADADTVAKFCWDAETMVRVRERIQYAVEQVRAAATRAALSSLDLDDEDASGDDSATDISEGTMQASQLDATDSDEELARRIVSLDLIGFFGVQIDPSTHDRDYREEGQSRMQIVREAAAQIIADRIDAAPRTAIDIIKFNHEARLLRSSCNKEGLLGAVKHLRTTGGTYTVRALDLALRRIEKKPSSVNMHHVVVISDAEDYYESQLRGHFLSAFKAKNVVFDFILIMSKDEQEACEKARKEGKNNYRYAMHDDLREVCAETGGEFTVVSNIENIRSTVYLQGMRLCLPSGNPS